MARVDYEAVFTELLGYAASKTSHGKTDLMSKMAELAEKHQVPEDLLEKAARILGGTIHVHTAEAHPASLGDQSIDEGMDRRPPPTDGQGGHDGRREARSRKRDPVGA